MKKIVTASRLFTPTEEIRDPLLFVEDGQITEISSRSTKELPDKASVMDFDGQILAPGFIDIHIHGGAGLDVMRASLTELPRLGQFLAKHGVSGYFPTTVAAPLDDTCAALERIAKFIEQSAENANGSAVEARPLGIHLEGPFLSHKRRGVHPPECLLPASLQTFEKLWQAAQGQVRMMTIAPEIPGALEVIAAAAKRGVCVSIGHSDAEMSKAQDAVNAGAKHATHTFNAMRPLDHRDPGILGEVLSDNRVSADLIADGIHVAPAVVKIFLQAKGLDRSVLITDAISATGMPDGRYRLGPIEVDVKDGTCTADGKLAGSVLTMDRAVRNVMAFAGWNLRDAVRAATLNPAQSASLAPLHGALAAGSEASFVVLGTNGEVRKTIVRGSSL